MAIYVDFMQIEFKGYKWCHMLADTLLIPCKSCTILPH